jgi:plastocyanin
MNTLFVSKSLAAPAGPVTIVFDNQDASVAHNVHFFSAAGSIGMVDIVTGPATETLSLGTLAPGSYSYKCDVHPTLMTGVLTVS